MRTKVMTSCAILTHLEEQNCVKDGYLESSCELSFYSLKSIAIAYYHSLGVACWHVSASEYLASSSLTDFFIFCRFKVPYNLVLSLNIKLQFFLVHLYHKIWCVIFELHCLHGLLFVNFNDQLLGADKLF